MNAPLGLRGAQINTHNLGQGTFVTCPDELAFNSSTNSFEREGKRDEDYGPISIAQMPVPVPTSRILIDLSWLIGAKYSLSRITIFNI